MGGKVRREKDVIALCCKQGRETRQTKAEGRRNAPFGEEGRGWYWVDLVGAGTE